MRFRMKTQTRTRTRSEFHVRIEGFQSLRIVVEDILIPPFSDVPGRGALLLNHTIKNTPATHWMAIMI